MLRTATRIFVIASVAFGIIGSVFFITLASGDVDSTASQVVFALRGVSGCVVLASFAVSVAGKYLSMNNDEATR